MIQSFPCIYKFKELISNFYFLKNDLKFKKIVVVSATRQAMNTTHHNLKTF